MKVEELIESPQLVGPLNDEEISKAVDFCAVNIEKAKALEKLSKSVTLYELTQSSGGYFFAHDSTVSRKSSILYLVRYRKVNFSPKALPSERGARQVLVWRVRSGAVTAGLPKRIFWDYLLPKFNVLISDSQQTAEGHGFWTTAVRAALDERKLKVRLIDTNDNTFEDFTDVQEFIDAEHRIWGKKPWFQRKVVAIIKEQP